MINQNSIESWKEELARALNKADEDAKTIAELRNNLAGACAIARIKWGNLDPDVNEKLSELELLADNKPNIDFPLSLKDEAE